MTNSSPLRLQAADDLREPVLILGYAGWSDGGDAASAALHHLLERLDVSPYASIDTEEFLDFTVVRPEVRLRDGDRREILWPDHEFLAARLPGQHCDAILGLGVEPHLRWRAYTRCVMELALSAAVRRVVLVGAFLDEVIYSQPVAVTVTSPDPAVVQRLGLTPIRYEGPTGILGVLADAFLQEGIECVSLWARIPHYISTRPHWRGAHALIDALRGVTGLDLDMSGLEKPALEFDEGVSKLVAGDPQLSAYVRELKRRAFTR